MKIDDGVIQEIDQVFEHARHDGVLSEHEVYRILSLIGLEVPRFLFLEEPAEVDHTSLQHLGPKIVVKIVSPQLAHKTKFGGVRVVDNLDPLFVQFVMFRMRHDVMTHFPPGSPPVIDGFLLEEYIPHTQALGNETLIGFKTDSAFGPVMTLSKGGDDAEFFARYFNPANLFLPPLEYTYARQMVDRLNIRHRFEEIGHPEYLDHVARALSLLSRLAYSFSPVSGRKPRYLIEELDINPFVLAEDGRFVAIDGFARFTPAPAGAGALLKADTAGLERFFDPAGVAVVGVSADANKYSLGREIAHLLHDLGRTDLYFINARGGSITFGDKEYPLYRKVSEVPAPMDLVIYAAPIQYTVDFFQDLSRTAAKAVILIPGIPPEVDYEEFVAKLREHVPAGVRVIGPNCMGIYYGADAKAKSLDTLFIDEQKLEVKHNERSNTVLLTQSGALAVTAIDKFLSARIFKTVVSFGNKYDVKLTDLISFFARMESIKVLSLYIEGLDPGEGRLFFELAGRTSKPILAYKAGRTEAGARAAASHTASMSGSYDVFKAACLQRGIILAETIEDYYNYMRIFSLLAGKPPAGNRVAGIVNAGFESTMGADELKGLRQARLDPATIERLNKINRFGLVDTSTPFLDITPMADDRMYADFVEAVLQDPGTDCVFVAVVPHAVVLKTTPDVCNDPESLANLLVDLNRKYDKPLVVSVNAGSHYQDFVSIMERNGLPVYGDIRAAIKSLDTFVSYHVGCGRGRNAPKREND